MSLTPQLVTAPTAYPVTLAEARNQLGMAADTESDVRLAALIAAATSMAEAYLNKALITRTYKAFLDRWPWCGWRRGASSYRHGWDFWNGAYALELPRPPLVSVGYVKTYDDSDTPTTFSALDYFVADAGDWNRPGRIVLRSGQSWPTPTRVANGIEIAWTCGLGTTLPAMDLEDIRLGILATIGALNEQRGDESQPAALPPIAMALLGPHRIIPV